ncbi:MAG: cysteine--tRNA ligase [Leptotrichiaceae bacterium]|nr:cysteine--tRNA ligase [Leptotrichiaceae bacterium]MBP6167605.1 cysteine--tRNA ligase [Leptotrichiaceae bacterium]MBP7025748.1 cysteine--tRNA ligase [Leptotrichiaceae bacterium]MBP8636717.1 cysteine--tRNA ligase [Leptotrichiaceae bacterium]MBP9538342.1 cysteine--tRNA ligase [Leptotrichiaceae bacterium]
MRIYNTLTNSIEELKTIEEKKLKLYVCGPTVYNYIHIGNVRPLVVFDILARYFEYKDFEVNYVQNFTDIDDKIIKRANEEGITEEEVTKKYIEAFHEDTSKLNLLKNINRPKVTENIPEIIDIIQKLIDKGYAYSINGDVFFDVLKYEKYGQLSNQKLDELELGSRVEIMEAKKNPMDFALWKNKKEGEPYWESPWGNGRPGWHIECSAMAHKYLGESFDIHGGGQDLIFPHHENEIAQSRCAYNGEFAKYWMHNGYVQLNGEKMSKSTGNFFLLREIEEKFSGAVIRLFIASNHYRKPMNFSFEEMENTKKTLENITNSMLRISSNQAEQEIVTDHEFIDMITKFDEKFEYAMEDDLNTPMALATIFDQIRETNKYIDNNGKSLGVKASYTSLKKKLIDVIGIEIEYDNKGATNDLTEKLIELLLNLRKEARETKNFPLSDKIRDELKAIGIEIKDNKDGTTTTSY